jgi:hypothetical protein
MVDEEVGNQIKELELQSQVFNRNSMFLLIVPLLPLINAVFSTPEAKTKVL